MRFATFFARGAVRYGPMLDDGPVDAAGLGIAELPVDLAGLLGRGPMMMRLVHEAALSAGPGAIEREVRLLPPIPRPGKIICLGLNYAEHAKEGGHAPPDYPAIFLRTPASLVAAGAPIVRPLVSETLDYEAELAVVIGRGGKDIPEERALGHVGAYSIFNDVSVRAYQRRSSQWTMGKNFDGTGPFGPVLVSPDEVPAGAAGLRIQAILNGQVLQDANTDDMIFKVAPTIALVSEVMTLEPGDVIAMGTPSGVGHARKPPLWMRPGDVCRIVIEGIGTLENPVVDAARA